jgi:hypothetical protein
MYLTSFVHREDLFKITERWLCDRLHPQDALSITQILICDGYIAGKTIEAVAALLLERIQEKPFRLERIRFKGELRDAICRDSREATPRIRELVLRYKNNPDFFYREAPINGVICLDKHERLIGLFRIKRPRRIAEKANRYIANWIFTMVQNRAQKMAEERAHQMGIPLQWLLTPPEEMEREFTLAENTIAQGFREGTISLDRSALTIHDVAGIKIVADAEALSRLEASLSNDPMIKVVYREEYQGDYRAKALILSVPWDKEYICREYMESQAWKNYLHRGIAEADLARGLDPLLENAEPDIHIELILSTFPDMVESELGNSIHEERIIAQRDNKIYKGYIPMNVEFLVEYLFRVGFSPRIHLDRLPVKLWGRYLPDTMTSYLRQLYNIPEYDFFF